MKGKSWLSFGASLILLSACRMPPKSLPVEETYQQAQKEIQQMFAKQEAIQAKIDFKQAMARGLQYNLDYRVKQANSAIKAGQMKMAEFAMVPEPDLSGSVYSRNNDNSSFGSDTNGNPTNVVAIGSDRTLRSYRASVKWNILDLGLGYVKAKQEGDRLLIAEEESRQHLQKLVHEIRVAYWNAYNAQLLERELNQFRDSLKKTKNLLNKALKDKEIPKQDLLSYQNSLLESDRRLVQLEDKLMKAAQEFKYLINMPLNQKIKLEKPPLSTTNIQDLKDLDFEKLDAITLVNRPELRGQNYQRHIAKLGTKAAILQALPGITFNVGRNFNSNSFLVNNFWNDRSVEISWNILNLAALPVTLDVAKTQVKYEKLKQMAITMGALNETRIAYSHYQSLAKECALARDLSQNAEQTYEMLRIREASAVASKQQVVLAKLRVLFAKMDEILVVSDLSAALGDLYMTAGFDVLPIEAMYASPTEVLGLIETNLKAQENMEFKQYVKLTYENLFGTNKKETL